VAERVTAALAIDLSRCVLWRGGIVFYKFYDRSGIYFVMGWIGVDLDAVRSIGSANDGVLGIK